MSNERESAGRDVMPRFLLPDSAVTRVRAEITIDRGAQRKC